MMRVVWLALALLLAGCAGEKTRERPARAQQVIDLGQQGQAAHAKGDLPRATRLFEQALKDAMHIEDSQGVAVMSINLARVSREAGDSAAALKRLDSVSVWHRGDMTAKTGQEMELLAAVLLADLGRADEARERLSALRDRCKSECELAIGVESLLARLTLEKGEAAVAAQVATAALARFRDHANQLEVANLFRVAGEAHRVLGDFSVARQSLENALVIDKSHGQPGKIAQDLDALARSALAAGDMPGHAGYVARLREVRQAPGANR